MSVPERCCSCLFCERGKCLWHDRAFTPVCFNAEGEWLPDAKANDPYVVERRYVPLCGGTNWIAKPEVRS